MEQIAVKGLRLLSTNDKQLKIYLQRIARVRIAKTIKPF